MLDSDISAAEPADHGGRPWRPSESLFSPMLLAGLALAPLPLPMLQPCADLALTALLRRYPNMFARLSSFGAGGIGIDPVDLPFVLLLKPSQRRVLLRRDFASCAPDAVIRGSLTTLVELCDGRLDGDAAFFARRLTFEGDTATVLALRNAIDDADIKLALPLRRILRPLHHRLSRDMNLVSAALLGPLRDEIAMLRRQINQGRDRP